MNKKVRTSPSPETTSLKLAAAVQLFIDKGGVINTVQNGHSGESSSDSHMIEMQETGPDDETLNSAKIEMLKGLVAKGAGVSALQYSLRMNRKDIKRLAADNGLTIRYSQPVGGSRPARQKESCAEDDVAAGHAMHYSSLGYSAPEIAQLLNLSVRDVWNIAKAYRIEFKQPKTAASDGEPSQD